MNFVDPILMNKNVGDSSAASKRTTARLICNGVRWGKAKVVDLSVAGCRIMHKGPMPMQGVVYPMRLFGDGGSVQVMARTVWVRRFGRRWEAGFAFQNVAEDDRQTIFHMAYDPTVFKHHAG